MAHASNPDIWLDEGDVISSSVLVTASSKRGVVRVEGVTGGDFRIYASSPDLLEALGDAALQAAFELRAELAGDVTTAEEDAA